MKKIRTTGMVLVAILVTSVAMATGNLKLSITPMQSDMAMVEVTNVESSNYELEVLNESGDMLFYKKTKDLANDYKRIYDFSNLEDGTYTLAVKIDSETNKSQFKIDRGNIEVMKESKVAMPYFTFADNKFKMTYLNYDKNEVLLYVYGDYGLVTSKDLSSDFAIHKGLDLSKLQKGNYRIVLEAGQEMFEYDIDLD